MALKRHLYRPLPHIHQMKKIFLLATVILIFSCDNRTADIRYYPADGKAAKKNSEVIELETTELNFGEITDKIGNFEDNNAGDLTVEFKDGKVTKRVNPYIFGIGLYKTKNVLKIKSDSVYIDDGYMIENLKPLLKRHYINKGEITKYSVSPEKAIVEVALDSNQSGKESLNQCTEKPVAL